MWRRALPGCGTGLWLLRAGHDTDLGSAREGEVRLWLLTQVVPSGLLLTSPFVLRERPELGRHRVFPSGWSSDQGSDLLAAWA